MYPWRKPRGKFWRNTLSNPRNGVLVKIFLGELLENYPADFLVESLKEYRKKSLGKSLEKSSDKLRSIPGRIFWNRSWKYPWKISWKNPSKYCTGGITGEIPARTPCEFFKGIPFFCRNSWRNPLSNPWLLRHFWSPVQTGLKYIMVNKSSSWVNLWQKS